MNIDDIYADIIIENDQENDDQQSNYNNIKDESLNTENSSLTLKDDSHQILLNKIKELEGINQSNIVEISKLNKKLLSKDDEIEILSKQNEQTKKVNEILSKNISCLFKTSLLEIQRKEKEINGLRDELANNKKQQSSNPTNNRHPNYEIPKK
ncbi:hypothetical protein RB653_001903 [Dictyostelium firmibasis]|uniref:Uncharacterized protein n=1 Tax=Dictyostelium firmibasis TaxID=79012 RepID=A0AAN7YS64_9MYCE